MMGPRWLGRFQRPVGDFLHEQYEDRDGRLVLFRCSKCGFTSTSLGATHGHIEGHRGYTRFNLQLPIGKTAPAKMDELMKRTEVLAVANFQEIRLADVEIR